MVHLDPLLTAALKESRLSTNRAGGKLVNAMQRGILAIKDRLQIYKRLLLFSSAGNNSVCPTLGRFSNRRITKSFAFDK